MSNRLYGCPLLLGTSSFNVMKVCAPLLLLGSLLLPGCTRDPEPRSLGAATIAGFERLKRAFWTPDGKKPNAPLDRDWKQTLVLNVENIHRGSRSFDLVAENMTSDLTITLHMLWRLTVIDDQGRVYEIDTFQTSMGGLGIPPHAKVRVPYVLASPLAADATGVRFSLPYTYFTKDGYPEPSFLPTFSWQAVPLDPTTAVLKKNEALAPSHHDQMENMRKTNEKIFKEANEIIDETRKEVKKRQKEFNAAWTDRDKRKWSARSAQEP